MKNYDESVRTNDSQNWSYIPDHPDRFLIVVDLGSVKLMCY